MSLRSLIALLLGGAFVASPAAAVESFRIDSNGDQSDANPGDAICATGAGACTLRAAIQEANANAGIDFILVDDMIATDPDGFVRITPQTPLPAITESALVWLDDAPGYDDSDPWATPIVQIDGSALSGSEPGLQITGAGAFGTTLRAIAIHGFPGHGVTADIDSLLIQGCHLGVEDGQFASGNGLHGIFLSGNDGIIGQHFFASTGWGGKGNVLSANTAYGFSTNGDDNLVAGNRIGTDPSGTFAMGNGGGGVFTSGERTEIGSVRTLSAGGDEASGNVIAGNFRGVWAFIGAVDTTIEANFIGTDATGNAALPNTLGVFVTAEGTTVGSLGLGSNVVSGNGGPGIHVVAAAGVSILNNRIGVLPDESGALPNVGAGVLGFDSPALNVFSNVIGGNGGHGIEVHGDQAFVNGNHIGTSAAGADLGNSGDGVHLFEAVASDVGSFSAPNVIAFNAGHGVFVDAIGSLPASIEYNTIGSAMEGEGAGNGLDGIHVKDSTPGEIRVNRVGENAGSGISISGGAASQGVLLIANETFSNGGVGIDLGDDGATANDVGDGDDGENRLQNTPEFDPAFTTYNSGTGQIEVRYRVDTNLGEAAYPLRIDFFLSDADEEEGQVWLGIGAVDSYPAISAGAFRSFAFVPPAGYVYGNEMILATAMDGNDNTSEFSAPVPLPEPGSLLGLAWGGGLLAMLARRRRDD